MEPLRRWDPEQIGGYTLLGRLGAGAMGQVYLGRTAAGRRVAVKTIRIELAEEPDFRVRFAQEVAAARRVSGAFTAPVVAADPEADVPWLATAYIAAPSLSTLVRTCGPLPVAAVCWLAAGCAEALESIHGAGLVHRDLKPSNVLVSADGPRVIDFGLARAAERIQLTLTRGAVGTPAYMAPEQARDTRQATTASDVYSLGATMLLAATGHGPYQADTVMDVLVRLATESPDLSGLPEDLADVVVACLQRDPASRPTSAAVLRQLTRNISPAAGSLDLGPENLPGPAMALLAEYRRGFPAPADLNPDVSQDDTFGSLPVFSQPRRRTGMQPSAVSAASPDLNSQPSAPGASPQVAADDPPGGATAGSATGGGTTGGVATGGSTAAGRSVRRPAVLALASVAAAVVLIGAGVAVGAYVADNRANSATTGIGRGFPPPGPGPAQGGPPNVVINQQIGDSQSDFVVIGAGWAPGSSVTIALAGVAAPAVHDIADSVGRFSYAINQGHEFFPGGLPLGTYQVVVTGGGARATAVFTVNRA